MTSINIFELIVGIATVFALIGIPVGFYIYKKQKKDLRNLRLAEKDYNVFLSSMLMAKIVWLQDVKIISEHKRMLLSKLNEMGVSSQLEELIESVERKAIKNSESPINMLSAATFLQEIKHEILTILSPYHPLEVSYPFNLAFNIVFILPYIEANEKGMFGINTSELSEIIAGDYSPIPFYEKIINISKKMGISTEIISKINMCLANAKNKNWQGMYNEMLSLGSEIELLLRSRTA